MTAKRRSGFTLVEVLIVVVIMAILAATIIPQFSDSSKDAKESNLVFNLHTLRSQIELYKSQHDGRVPEATDPVLEELFNKTNALGVIDATDSQYGPYVRDIPDNPFSASKAVKAVGNNPPGVGDVTANNAGGWLYHIASGGIWIDHSDYFDK